jgi:hypothetical protein
MALASYLIAHSGDGWCVRHGTQLSQPYATREAAFEATLGPASNAIRAGEGVRIEVEEPRESEAALGNS